MQNPAPSQREPYLNIEEYRKNIIKKPSSQRKVAWLAVTEGVFFFRF